MSYNIYRILHLSGVFMVLVPLGAVILHIASGGTKENFKLRKKSSLTHGIGLLLALVGGFGLMARLGLGFTDNNWLFIKIVIWGVLGFLPLSAYKASPEHANRLWAFIFIVGAFAIYLANYKPF